MYSISEPVRTGLLKGTRATLGPFDAELCSGQRRPSMRVPNKYPMVDPYVLSENGTWLPPAPPSHRDGDYDSSGFETLRAMQARHFWYRGRHRFIFHFTRRIVRALRHGERKLDAI